MALGNDTVSQLPQQGHVVLSNYSMPLSKKNQSIKLHWQWHPKQLTPKLCLLPGRPCLGESECFQYFTIKCCLCVKGWTYDSSTVTNLFKNLAGSSNQNKPSQEMLNRTCSWVSVRHLESHLADTFLIPSSIVWSRCKEHVCDSERCPK